MESHKETSNKPFEVFQSFRFFIEICWFQRRRTVYSIFQSTKHCTVSEFNCTDVVQHRYGLLAILGTSFLSTIDITVVYHSNLRRPIDSDVFLPHNKQGLRFGGHRSFAPRRWKR